ncbi:AraC-like DNA-binding protein [Prauserella shujinwangii]|uniref:AraC-like DNA-binding protein n=1 Tax=Prauserella shujinwangii TaxID=1453103 RepID=A0A2T0LZP4_9PSEU|nr:helix-turn-helix domain-containing protein [Prauserella shujinwangii]PRX49570.1 AraC-like DNA-binding protein [Prauserella shujinwangii]
MTSLVNGLLAGELADPGRGREIAFDSWKNVVERTILRFRFDCERPQAFRGTVHRRSLAGVDFVGMTSERHGAYRTAETITSDDAGCYVMTLQLSGEFRMSQHERTAVLRPGSFALYDSSVPTVLVSSDDYRSVCIKFAKDWLGPRGAEPFSELTATAFDAEDGLPSIVWTMVLGLGRSLHTLGAEGPLAVRNLMDLVTAMLRAELGRRGPPATERREALLRRVREYIDARLPDPALSPTGIAAAHYISPRLLHQLFEGSGWTVGAWIRARRVELCRRDLADPLQAGVPVAAIGLRHGFKGASHFGEVFKREVGRTPAEFRREALARFPG